MNFESDSLAVLAEKEKRMILTGKPLVLSAFYHSTNHRVTSLKLFCIINAKEGFVWITRKPDSLSKRSELRKT